MSLVLDAKELVPGDPDALRALASAWRRLDTLLEDRRHKPDAARVRLVGVALDDLAEALAALQDGAVALFDDVRGERLPERILFGDASLLRRTLVDRPELTPVIEGLIARGTDLRLRFVDAQHDFIDRLQPIARNG